MDHTMTEPNTSQPVNVPEDFEAWRVPDARFARAYARTGDEGRALVKSCIAALFEGLGAHGPAATSATSLHHSGLVRTEERHPRPWYALVIGPDARSPSMLAAALLPAVAARLPLVMAVRLGARGWPDPLLATLELCGVEQAYAPPLKEFKSCLKFLADTHGFGGVACMGQPDFAARVRALVPGGCAWVELTPPGSVGLLASPDIPWDLDALSFSLGEAAIDAHLDEASLAAAGHWAVYAPAGRAPAGASLVVEPGRETVWDWPGLPGELFFSRRLVYN